MKLLLGDETLDRLVGGGVAPGSNVLFYGPSFRGKEMFVKQSILANMRKGVPCICIVTTRSAHDLRQELDKTAKDFEALDAKGLLWIVDTYSEAVGAADPAPNVVYVDSAVDLNGIALAVNKAQADILPSSESHVLVLDSLSTLVLYNEAAPTFRFLQVLLGRAKQAGATSLILLDDGMHDEAEVQMFNHIMAGCIRLRYAGDKNELSALGLGAKRSDWVEYSFDESHARVTGSLGEGRIK